MAAFCLAALVLTIFVRRYRLLRRQLAQAQRALVQLGRHKDRLELVLRQAEPAMHAQVKARSDMEWQQATKHLGEEEVPVLFPLEPAFSPISPFAGASTTPGPQGG